MKNLAAGVIFAILCIAFLVQAADEPSFMGSWILDKGKSDAAPRPVMDLGAAPGGRGGMGGGGMGMPGGFPGGMGGRGGQAQEPKIYPVIIEQNGDQVTIKATISVFGKEMPTSETVQCDGKEHESMVPGRGAMGGMGGMMGGMGGRGGMGMPGGGGQPGAGAQQQPQQPPAPVKQIVKATLKKNKLEIEKKTFYQPNLPSKEKRSYSLSKDGSVLTQKTSTETPSPGFGGGVATNYITEQTQVYNREQPGSDQKK